jgi:hypothetical protein
MISTTFYMVDLDGNEEVNGGLYIENERLRSLKE